VGAVSGTHDEGVLTDTGVRVPLYKGDFLSPRPFYESKEAALLAYQGFIHYAELAEAHLKQIALDLACSRFRNCAPIPDNELDTLEFVEWAYQARSAREKAELLALIAVGAQANAAAAEANALRTAEQTSIARAKATQINAQNVQEVTRTITPATGEETFIHTTVRTQGVHTPESAAINIAETKSMNLSPSGAVGQWGEGAYAYEGALPPGPSTQPQVQFSVPKGTAIERIQIPGQETIIRLVPPSGNTLTITNPIVGLSPAEYKAAADWLNQIRRFLQ